MPGAAPGLISAGSAYSGPDRSPTPPLTSAAKASADQSRPTGPAGRSGGTDGGRGVGMVPQTGTGRRDGDEHQTWLTEDEDAWGLDEGPINPGVIR